MPSYLQKYYELTAVVRPDVVAEGREFTIAAADELAEWCGGELEVRDGRHVFVVSPGPVGPGGVAELGDYVMRYGAEQWVEPAGSFTSRWHAEGVDVPVEPPVRVYEPFDVVQGHSPWS